MKRSAFPLVFWCVGPRSDVLEAEGSAGVAKGEGLVAGAVVGHHAADGDAEASVVGAGILEEGGCALLLLVGHDLAEGDT